MEWEPKTLWPADKCSPDKTIIRAESPKVLIRQLDWSQDSTIGSYCGRFLGRISSSTLFSIKNPSL